EAQSLCACFLVGGVTQGVGALEPHRVAGFFLDRRRAPEHREQGRRAFRAADDAAVQPQHPFAFAPCNAAQQFAVCIAQVSVCLHPGTGRHHYALRHALVLAPGIALGFGSDRHGGSREVRPPLSRSATRLPDRNPNGQSPWRANSVMLPSVATSSTAYGWTRPSGISMPGEPAGMPGTVSPRASGESASRRLTSVAGTWPSMK